MSVGNVEKLRGEIGKSAISVKIAMASISNGKSLSSIDSVSKAIEASQICAQICVDICQLSMELESHLIKRN